jgi:hypothetical protein
MLYKTLKWPQTKSGTILHLAKNNYGVHTIKPQLSYAPVSH